jgi:5'-methylthioadenosine phosphorylase
VTHIDFTHPFCEETRAMVLAAARDAGIQIQDGGTYAAVQGPRLETKAEIDRFERDGATMVGMTVMPEAALARELQMSYAAIAVCVNAAAGRGESLNRVALDDIAGIIDTAMEKVRHVVEKVVERHVDS